MVGTRRIGKSNRVTEVSIYLGNGLELKALHGALKSLRTGRLQGVLVRTRRNCANDVRFQKSEWKPSIIAKSHHEQPQIFQIDGNLCTSNRFVYLHVSSKVALYARSTETEVEVFRNFVEDWQSFWTCQICCRFLAWPCAAFCLTFPMITLKHQKKEQLAEINHIREFMISWSFLVVYIFLCLRNISYHIG